jgi:hypothetical protein
MAQFERQGRVSEPMTRSYPAIIAGTCEYCGVIDQLQPAEMQYKLCPHFKDIKGDVQCTYCPETVNPVDVIRGRKIIVHGSPGNPNEVIAVCDSYNCSQAHLKRFKRNTI